MYFQKIPLLPPTKGIGNSEGGGGGGGGGEFSRAKKLKKCMDLNWNFQRGRVLIKKISSVGEVWIFHGTTHSDNLVVKF